MKEKIALDDIQRAKIELEEKYRSEYRARLEETTTKKSLPGTLWTFVNSSLGLWLLSAIFISGVGALYTQYRDARTEKMRTRELVERLDLEIGYRFSQIQIRLYSIVDSKHPAYPLLADKGEEDVRNVLNGLSQPSKAAITPLYQEFSNMSTIALIAELRRYIPRNERDEIDQVLAHMSGIHIHLDAEKIKLSDVKGVADMIFQSLMLRRWKESRFYFTDCTFC